MNMQQEYDQVEYVDGEAGESKWMDVKLVYKATVL